MSQKTGNLYGITFLTEYFCFSKSIPKYNLKAEGVSIHSHAAIINLSFSTGPPSKTGKSSKYLFLKDRSISHKVLPVRTV